MRLNADILSHLHLPVLCLCVVFCDLRLLFNLVYPKKTQAPNGQPHRQFQTNKRRLELTQANVLLPQASNTESAAQNIHMMRFSSHSLCSFVCDYSPNAIKFRSTQVNPGHANFLNLANFLKEPPGAPPGYTVRWINVR